MRLAISIDGTDVSTHLGTIKIDKAINGRMSQAAFQLGIDLPSMSLPVNQSEVIITNTANSSKVFRGIITNTAIDQKSGTLQFWNIGCTGNEYLLENSIITHSWTGQTDRQIIQSAFSIALPAIATTSATVAELSVAIDFDAKDMTLLTLVEQLAQISGADFRITEDLALDYHASGSVVAPFGFSDHPNV